MDANEGASRMGHEGGPHLASRPGAQPWCTVLGVREDRVGERDRLAPDARYDLLWRIEPTMVPHPLTREEATR